MAFYGHGNGDGQFSIPVIGAEIPLLSGSAHNMLQVPGLNQIQTPPLMYQSMQSTSFAQFNDQPPPYYAFNSFAQINIEQQMEAQSIALRNELESERAERIRLQNEAVESKKLFDETIRTLREEINKADSRHHSQNMFSLKEEYAILSDELQNKERELRNLKKDLSKAPVRPAVELPVSDLESESAPKLDQGLRLAALRKELETEKAERKRLQKEVAVSISIYESRVNHLDQEICRLKSDLKQANLGNTRLAQKKKDLEAQCAKLKADLLEKIQKSSDSRSTLNNVTSQNDALLAQLSEHKEKLLMAEKLEAQLKKRHDDVFCRLQISKLKEQNSKLKEENEMLKANYTDLDRCRRELGLEKTKIDQLQAEFDNQQAELQESSQKLRKVEVENSELTEKLKAAKSSSEQLKTELEDRKTELQKCKDQQKKSDEEYYELNFQVNNLEDDLDQKEKEMLRLQKLSDKIKAELDTCQADLNRAQDGMSRVTEERDRLKMELEIANDNSEAAMERIIKLDLKLKVEREKHIAEIAEIEDLSDKNKAEFDTCKDDLMKARDDRSRVSEERDRLKVQLKTAIDNSETAMERISKLDRKLKVDREKYIAEIDKLKEDLAHPSNLKEELEKVKKDNKYLSDDNCKLRIEANRLWKEVYERPRALMEDIKYAGGSQGWCGNIVKSEIDDVIELSDDEEVFAPVPAKKKKQ